MGWSVMVAIVVVALVVLFTLTIVRGAAERRAGEPLSVWDALRRLRRRSGAARGEDDPSEADSSEGDTSEGDASGGDRTQRVRTTSPRWGNEHGVAQIR